MTLYKRGVALPLLPQVEQAKRLVQMEVQECAAYANKLKPNWAQTIFQEALQFRERLMESEAQKAELAEQEKLGQLEEKAKSKAKQRVGKGAPAATDASAEEGNSKKDK
jgi:hypothetical protein